MRLNPDKKACSSRSAIQWLLCAGLILSAIDYPIFYGLRLVDFILIAVLLIYMCGKGGRFRYSTIAWAMLIGLMLVPSLLSLATDLDIDYARAIFLYKYFFFVILPAIAYWAFCKAPGGERSNLLLAQSFFIFLFVMIGWVFGHVVLATSGVLEAHPRVSYLFSKSYFTESMMDSDAHLYSTVLAAVLLSYLIGMARFLQHSVILQLIITLSGVLALSLTGSRGGLLLFLTGAVFVGALNIGRISSAKVRLTSVTAGLVLILVGLGLFQSFILSGLDGSFALLERAFSFDFFNDESTRNRLSLMRLGVNQAFDGGVLVGSGIFFGNQTWFLSIPATVFAHFGMMGFALLIAMIGLLMRAGCRAYRMHKAWGSKALIILGVVFLANLIGEYALTSRALIVFVLCVIFFLQRAFLADGNPPCELRAQGVPQARIPKGSLR